MMSGSPAATRSGLLTGTLLVLLAAIGFSAKAVIILFARYERELHFDHY
jgi:hypothetical protein